MKHDQLHQSELCEQIVEHVANDGATLPQLIKVWKVLFPNMPIKRLDDDTVIVSTPTDEDESSG